ncbi:hypothetical protein [Streptobacillus canis]|uniref:hypothetical protein n=1 Tax=Streptobacillus canis TaxID=2678686 RepID=UPI0012E2A4F3|nr:hypothetical protein [Streptobacillus canis]
MKKIFLFLLFFINFSEINFSKDLNNEKKAIYENVKIINGLKQGKFLIKFDDDSIEEGYYKNGKKEGKYKKYFENNTAIFQTFEEGEYKKGEKIFTSIFSFWGTHNINELKIYYSKGIPFKYIEKETWTAFKDCHIDIKGNVKNKNSNISKEECILLKESYGYPVDFTEYGFYKNGEKSTFTRKYVNGLIKKGYYIYDNSTNTYTEIITSTK